MYRIPLFILALLISFSLTAQQSVDNIPGTKLPECPDISYTSSVFFTRLMQKQQYDSAQKVLEYWESKCGLREPVFRAKIMLAFATNKDIDTLIDQESLYLLKNYYRRAEMIKSRDFSEYDYRKSNYGYVPIGQEIDSFSSIFFEAEYEKQKKYTISFLLCEYYGKNTDSLFSRIKSEEYQHTELAKEYNSVIKRRKEVMNGNYSLLTGVWVPTGDIELLGSHPMLGFQLGGKYKRFNVDITLYMKFLRAKNSYYATRTKSDSSVVYTDNFFGAYIGLDFSYDILKWKNNDIQFLGGIGWDGFDAIDEDKSNDFDAEMVSSYNLNIGLGHRFYLSSSLYIGLQAKYNFVDYRLNRVIDFTGNPVTITFIIGGLSINNTYDPFVTYNYYRPYY